MKLKNLLTNRARKEAGYWMTCILTSIILCGCSQKNMPSPSVIASEAKQSQVVTTNESVDCQSVDEMDFLDCMVRKPKCTVADAVRAIGIFVAGEDPGKNYDQRYEYLLERKIVRTAWKLNPDQWIDRGTLAYMMLKSADIKGGINMLLLGSNGLGDRRYAYREMMYLNLMQEGVDYNFVSGPELVTAIGKLDDYVRKHQKTPQETNLGKTEEYKQ